MKTPFFTNPISHLWVALAIAILFGALIPNSQAVGLSSATVIDFKNEANLEKDGEKSRTATVGDKVQGKDRLWTGKKSRAELEFTDHSIARLGSSTIFSFDPVNRNMKVDQGTALIHVPPGLSGAQISSPSATAAIQGDVLAMRVNDQGLTQFVALSQDSKGPVKVTFNKTGESRNLLAGQMLTIDPMAIKMPEPVNVAVDVFIQSSNLARGFKKELPDSAKKEIKQTVTLQVKEIKTGALDNRAMIVASKNDVPMVLNNTGQNQIITQATTGSGFAGTFSGTSTVLVGGGSGCSSLVLNISPDGRVMSSCTSSGGGGVDIGNGFISTTGNFSITQNNGEIITGTAIFGNSTISGTFSQAATATQSAKSGVFSVSR